MRKMVLDGGACVLVVVFPVDMVRCWNVYNDLNTITIFIRFVVVVVVDRINISVAWRNKTENKRL